MLRLRDLPGSAGGGKGRLAVLGGAPPALQDPRSVPHSGVFCGKGTELRLGPHFGVPFLARYRLGGGARGTLRAQERHRGSATAFTGLISAAGWTLAGIMALQNLPAGPWAGISSAVWLRAPLRTGGTGLAGAVPPAGFAPGERAEAGCELVPRAGC